MRQTPSERIRATRNLKYLRTSNRAEVLRLLATEGSATRLTLAKRLGLTKMAVGMIASELQKAGLVGEHIEAAKLPVQSNNVRRHTAAAGRPAAMLTLLPDQITALGLYLSRDAINGVLADISGRIIRIWRLVLDTWTQPITPENYINQIRRLVRQMSDETKDCKVAGFGVSSIGPLDRRQGRLLAPPNFHDLADLPLRQILEETVDLPVFLDNDMNAAGLAEYLYGAGRSSGHMIYVGLTNGVGAGIIVNGQIFRGGSGFTGEIGHMSLQMDGPFCDCGHRGCLELYASIPVILRKAGRSSLDDLLRTAAGIQPDGIWRRELIDALGTALINLANLFDPDLILIGHEGSRLVPLIQADLQQKLDQGIFQRQSKHIPVQAAAFGSRTPLIGAAALVFQAVFQGELNPLPPEQV